MKWTKRGLLFLPGGELDWMQTHATVPLADRIADRRYRIYFATRNRQNMSQIGWVETDLEDPLRILRVSEKPALTLGPLGTFDDSGVFPSWIVTVGDEKYLYYAGWMQGKRVRYYSALGLAVSSDGGRTFRRTSPAPLLHRNEIDPYFTTQCCVHRTADRWRMWYTSALGWEAVGDMETWPPEAVPRYHIRYAESDDGVGWQREGHVAIDFLSAEENAITRPCVVEDQGSYRMWYCYRGTAYRIGYAESRDGIRWRRRDTEAGIDVSDSGWDSEMIAYPFVFKEGPTYHMLYNGNDFGRTGIGYATLENPPRSGPRKEAS